MTSPRLPRVASVAAHMAGYTMSALLESSKKVLLDELQYPWKTRCIKESSTSYKAKTTRIQGYTELSGYICINRKWCDHHASVKCEQTIGRSMFYHYRRTCNYRIALGERTSVYRGTQSCRRSACGPNDHLKERSSSCR